MMKPKKPIKMSPAKIQVGKGKKFTTDAERKAALKKVTDMKSTKPNFMKKGGMSCSCGGKGCMKCGGKKYQNGGLKKYQKGGEDEYNRNIGAVMKADRERDSLIGIRKGTMYQGMSGPGLEYYDKKGKKIKVVSSPQATDADMARYKKEMDDYYKSTTPTKKPVTTIKKVAAKKFKDGGKHRGFKAVQESIAKKQGISMEAAGAILASSSRKASPKAKKANPRLLKVKGKAKK